MLRSIAKSTGKTSTLPGAAESWEESAEEEYIGFYLSAANNVFFFFFFPSLNIFLIYYAN